MGEDRRERLLEHLRSREGASVEELADLLGVSKMTVHRDLDRLADNRLIRKIRGGATLQPSVVFESEVGYRRRQNRSEKEALAARVAELVEPGMALILDDSTTTGSIIPFILNRTPLTIVTNAVPLINSLSRQDGITLISLGGRYDPIADAFFGIGCETSAGRIRADLGIFSTAAVHGASAFLHDQDIARAKLAMMASSDRRVIAFDRSKFGKSALNLFTPLAAFDHVFIPDTTEASLIAVLEREKVKVELVPMTAPERPANSILEGTFR
ncbi:DeoR/GlpR family DNA-binding transcription regulator [soil metagenome]